MSRKDVTDRMVCEAAVIAHSNFPSYPGNTLDTLDRMHRLPKDECVAAINRSVARGLLGFDGPNYALTDKGRKLLEESE